MYAGFTQEFGFSTVNNVLNIPIGVQEMVLAVWLIVKGFNTSAVTADRAAVIADQTALPFDRATLTPERAAHVEGSTA